MLCRRELEETLILAEESGFRGEIVSIYYAFFRYEFIPEYDISVTYRALEGEAEFEVEVERKENMTPEELKALCDASGLCLGLIKHMGGISFD